MKMTWIRHEYALHYNDPERNTKQNMPWCASHMVVASVTGTLERENGHWQMMEEKHWTLADVPWG